MASSGIQAIPHEVKSYNDELPIVFSDLSLHTATPHLSLCYNHGYGRGRHNVRMGFGL
jgi:hypothetical protein